jgi:LemA protein
MSTGISGLAVLVVLIGFVALVGIYAMGVYNGLVKLRNMFKNAFSQIDVQLKRRHDLIPNLVETAKAYMAHESGTLEAVIAARNGAESARQNAAANPGDAAALHKRGAAYPEW